MTESELELIRERNAAEKRAEEWRELFIGLIAVILFVLFALLFGRNITIDPGLNW